MLSRRRSTDGTDGPFFHSNERNRQLSMDPDLFRLGMPLQSICVGVDAAVHPRKRVKPVAPTSRSPIGRDAWHGGAASPNDAALVNASGHGAWDPDGSARRSAPSKARHGVGSSNSSTARLRTNAPRAWSPIAAMAVMRPQPQRPRGIDFTHAVQRLDLGEMLATMRALEHRDGHRPAIAR